MNHREIAIFAHRLSREFGEKVSAHLGVPLSAHEEREFEDGEHKIRPLINVRGNDVFVVQSLYGDGWRAYGPSFQALSRDAHGLS
jgi:ribose-phosphate pyrophosphokinase